MSEQNPETPASDTPQEKPQEGSEEQAKTFDAEYVDKLRKEAAKYRTEAKANADAAKRLAEIEDAQKSETEKAADRIAKAEAEVASVPAKVADALKAHLITLHEISDDDAELFLTASDPELLLKQVSRLVERNAEASQDAIRPRAPKPDPNQGRTPTGAPLDPRSADLAQIEADLKAAKRR